MSKLNYNAISKREFETLNTQTNNNYSMGELIYSVLRLKSLDLKVKDIKNITDEEFLALTERAIKVEKDE